MVTAGGAVVIYGAGGHGKVVLDALERSGRQVVGFVDDDAKRVGGEHCGYEVRAASDLTSPAAGEVIVAIGDARGREELTARLVEIGIPLATAIHPTAVLGRDVRVEDGAMILAGAVINPGVLIGRGAIINTGAIVDHDCRIGTFAHVAPGARLAGHVSVGERALVGAGATVMPGVAIGRDAVVGAGAAVVTDVAAGTTVVGVPARGIERRGERT